MFHVSWLKKHVGHEPIQHHLPMIDNARVIAKEPLVVLDGRMIKSHEQACTEVLI